MYLTEQFAHFIAETDYASLPEKVRSQAKERIMDTLGAAIAGCVNWDYSRQLISACRDLGSGTFAVIGSHEKVFPAARAAMIDATFAHSVELDDGHKNAGCHAGAVIVPTALVMGNALNCSGREIITAVAVGYEVTYRIASHVNPAQINKGFHPSSNCGVYGAMAVAGKLMGLSEKQLANGLGQAGMLASGTMEATKSGQRSKCVQVGNAAYNGIMSALLAQNDMEGCLSALEGPNGLFNTQSENVNVEDVCRDLGKVWSISDTYNKLYPCCRHAQPGIEAVLDLVSENGITPDQVEKIWIGTHKVAWELTGTIKAPRNSGEAKFSLAYGSAVALRDHQFGIADLTPRYYEDPELLALAEKVTCVIDPEVQSYFPKKRGAKVRITLKDGRVLERDVYDLKGSPANPVGWEVLEKKFRSCAEALLDKAGVDRVLNLISALEQQSDVHELMSLLSR
jgi:2-methylcitrate dehydratase PrpD